MGRARGQIGAPARSMGGGLFSAIVRSMADKLPPTERVPLKVKKPNGSSTASRASFPDELLAAMRHDHEVNGLSTTRCASKYGIGIHRAENLLTYLSRANVKPAPLQPAQGGVVSTDEGSLLSHSATVLFLPETVSPNNP